MLHEEIMVEEEDLDARDACSWFLFWDFPLLWCALGLEFASEFASEFSLRFFLSTSGLPFGSPVSLSTPPSHPIDGDAGLANAVQCSV